MVKDGYKQTKIGVIPKDWDATTLGDVAEVIMGQSPKGTSYNRYGDGLPLINGPTEFTKKHPIKVQWTTEPTKLCKPLDLLLCVRGSSTGRMNIAKDEFCIGRGVAAIRANPRANTEYLTYQVHLAIEKLLALSAGSTFPSVDGKAIKSIPLPCPEAEEQRAIAQALSDVDTLIAALDKLIAKKRNLKTATMQQLLTGRKRLPGFGEGKGYKESAIGLIPEDWDVISIQTALDEKYIEDQMDGNHGELYPRSHEFVGYGVPYIGANDFWNGRVSFKNCKFLSEARARKFKKGIARSGDVLFAHNATVGPVALLEFNNDFLILSTTATYFRCNLEELNNSYFRFVLEAQYFIKQYRSVMAQSTRFQVPITTQRKFLIAVPPLEEQRAIATVLSDMDAAIAGLESRLAKTQAIKQGMMQELLTGRVRLKIET